MKRILIFTLGHVFLALGIAGAILPLLPTTPFLLLAAYCYSKSSERMHGWIIRHKYLGPPMRDWQESGVIGIKAKVIATIMISAVIAWRFPLLAVQLWIKLLATAVLIGVLIFIWTRPSRAKRI
jgi:uncharacterized membrane protein YbaN (DUF454 family)